MGEYIRKDGSLNIGYIRENSERVDWFSISSLHQKLNEPFIREFKDRVDWFCISAFQKLSEPFIITHKVKVIEELNNNEIK